MRLSRRAPRPCCSSLKPAASASSSGVTGTSACSAGSGSSCTAYRRVGNTTLAMSADEYNRMLFERMHSGLSGLKIPAGGRYAVGVVVGPDLRRPLGEGRVGGVPFTASAQSQAISTGGVGWMKSTGFFYALGWPRRWSFPGSRPELGDIDDDNVRQTQMTTWCAWGTPEQSKMFWRRESAGSPAKSCS